MGHSTVLEAENLTPRNGRISNLGNVNHFNHTRVGGTVNDKLRRTPVTHSSFTDPARNGAADDTNTPSDHNSTRDDTRCDAFNARENRVSSSVVNKIRSAYQF
jgi:hypothetical protein